MFKIPIILRVWPYDSFLIRMDESKFDQYAELVLDSTTNISKKNGVCVMDLMWLEQNSNN